MAKSALIDLSSGDTQILDTNEEDLKRFLGARGLGARMLYDLVDPQIEPFSPDNYLIFSVGPLSGTSWPTAARYHVTFKSPATNAYGYASSGGHFGPELRRAGYDALVITGKAPQPTVIRIVDNRIELVSAAEIWGKPTSAVEDYLTRNGGRVVAIGRAGENLVRIAAIINDGGRAAARGGPGAVMGSKNLKAIHVRATSKHSPSSAEFGSLVKSLSRRLLEHPSTQGLMKGSTLFLMSIKNSTGDLPAKNHQFGQVPFIHSLTTEAFEAYWTKRKGCAACPMRCARISEVGQGKHAARIEGPEYETADAFGPMCWNANPEVIIRANHLCNEYGLDTISTGVAIAFAMECHQRGFLNDARFSLEWGDADTILGLIKSIAERDGLGDLLAEGVQRAAAKIGRGAQELAMHVKGLELPRQEPRIAKAFGLGHATSNRGADHLYGLPTIDLAGHWDAARKLFPEDILPQLMDTADETYKPDILIYGENFCAVIDSLGVCKFSTAETYCLMPEDLAKGLLELGYEFTAEELLTIGERIVNLERLYNLRHGLKREQDKLPARFTNEPLDIFSYSFDPDSGEALQSETPVVSGALVALESMLDRYYELRGWDKNGVPTSQTLDRLGLKGIAMARQSTDVT
jgi:aldehyde:ferredoxin oxidoreductase